MHILVHYSEIGLKGKNRAFFEKKLVKNIKKILKGIVKREFGRIIIKTDEKWEEVKKKLSKVFGIAWFANCLIVKSEKDAIIKKALEIAKKFEDIKSVKVCVKRANKKFPLTSLELAKLIGKELKKMNFEIKMKNPDKKIFIEISNQTYIFTEKYAGLRGLPVGTSGKVLCLLSGGIDSAVAAWLMLKRGCEVDYLHFHALEKNEKVLKSKIVELIKILNKFAQRKSKLFVLPYHNFELATIGVGRYELVLFRRFMNKIAEKIAGSEYKAIVTGESLAQVASQTLDNLFSISKDIRIPIFRPLIGFDKEEIINLAKKIGTYEISIKPYKDCCSLIQKHPTTKAKFEKVKKFEQVINLEKIVDETLENLSVFEIEF